MTEDLDEKAQKEQQKQKAKSEAKEKAEKAKLAAVQAKNTRSKQKNKPVLYESPDTDGMNLEDALEEELTAVQKGFRNRAKAENKRFEEVTDSEYWFAICFRTREQKERFLKAMNWIEYGDKYLSGELIANQMGVEIGESDLEITNPKIDKDYAKLSL